MQLGHNVGAVERVQVSNVVDGNAGGTALELAPELTSVEVLDYAHTHHLNFEAEIRFREIPCVVQVETFSVSVNAEGACLYNMQFEAVMRLVKEHISLYHLARILVDVQQYVSAIVDSVIS